MHDNKSRVSWYTISTAMCCFFILPCWIYHETLLYEVEYNMIWIVNIVGIPCRYNFLLLILLLKFFPLFIRILREPLALSIGFLVIERLVLTLGEIWGYFIPRLPPANIIWGRNIPQASFIYLFNLCLLSQVRCADYFQKKEENLSVILWWFHMYVCMTST